ncbi:hypothetical protein KP509_35G037700 [Ceratopteris richardii]|uniref:Strictosidine synthase conserved region domain-containing protein n=1 Tax=Ceratopteris richardii TaxID=49495 RepID=A0A8T2QGM4_CERRI|nr:hypothetical protein KP509_35G037700 [Ceratopteris richardii]KAH7282584.1 hypothetical protein KP509_35G037700 [Ceratopteris richardii]
MEGSYICVMGLVMAIGLLASWQALIRHSPIDPLPTVLPLPPLPKGVYATNRRLQAALERLGDAWLPQPEDLVISSDGRFMYAACSDGWIKQVELADGRVRNWTHIRGGRPLGLARGVNGEILACEPSLGLLNITEGRVETLSDNACGVKFKFADSLDINSDDGCIYFTDASTKFGYGESDFDVLEARPNGRLLRYDPSTKSTTVVLTNLYFPNGVAVSLDRKFVVFCETSKVRCQKLWLKGPYKGRVDEFIENLPGFPDNIHVTERGTFWIGLVSGRSLVMETILGFPSMKHLLATSVGMRILDVNLRMAKVLEVSNDGKPLRFMEDPNGKAIGFVTCALEHEKNLYLGGLKSSFVGKLRLE